MSFGVNRRADSEIGVGYHWMAWKSQSHHPEFTAPSANCAYLTNTSESVKNELLRNKYRITLCATDAYFASGRQFKANFPLGFRIK
ncbi:uncharacterized protein ARMOST_12758 [Armillaria ostoyae]|uniref:Uncharacterized protein n=1 Tax=Armillaria ostoyae TaxID=47428 RepID=A0A284RKV0_ARMOS|nr:uncharacterized protein ARMOST_12758 [Armillaria ostoyae]